MCVLVFFVFFINFPFPSKCLFAGSRRSRNRSRGQLIVKNTKASTLAFESDFDFESANAQFKDLTKQNVGMF